jgi:hypothetical protein
MTFPSALALDFGQRNVTLVHPEQMGRQRGDPMTLLLFVKA